MPQVPKEDDHLEAVRRRVEQQETRRRLEEQELQEAEAASWEEEEIRQAREISLEEAQKKMEEEIALWLREEEALQEALEESKREGIGKMQEEVAPFSTHSPQNLMLIIFRRWSPSSPQGTSTRCCRCSQGQAKQKCGKHTGKSLDSWFSAVILLHYFPLSW